MPAGNLLYWALVALVIALVAAVLGFGGIAGAAADIARILFWIFLVIFLVVLVMNFMGKRGGPTVCQSAPGPLRISSRGPGACVHLARADASIVDRAAPEASK